MKKKRGSVQCRPLSFYIHNNRLHTHEIFRLCKRFRFAYINQMQIFPNVSAQSCHPTSLQIKIHDRKFSFPSVFHIIQEDGRNDMNPAESILLIEFPADRQILRAWFEAFLYSPIRITVCVHQTKDSELFFGD